jgi:hypothetical protein
LSGSKTRHRIGSGKTRSRVAVVRTRPESVLDDVAAMMRGVDYTRAISPGRRTILKDNISWHLPFLSANTTPWQLEGVVRTLRQDGYRDLLGLHNQPAEQVHGRLPALRGADRQQLLARLPLGADRAERGAARAGPHLR